MSASNVKIGVFCSYMEHDGYISYHESESIVHVSQYSSNEVRNRCEAYRQILQHVVIDDPDYVHFDCTPRQLMRSVFSGHITPGDYIGLFDPADDEEEIQKLNEVMAFINANFKTSYMWALGNPVDSLEEEDGWDDQCQKFSEVMMTLALELIPTIEDAKSQNIDFEITVQELGPVMKYAGPDRWEVQKEHTQDDD